MLFRFRGNGTDSKQKIILPSNSGNLWLTQGKSCTSMESGKSRQHAFQFSQADRGLTKQHLDPAFLMLEILP